MTWLRDAWYVAAYDAELDTAPLARTICGVPMLFYRALDRSVVAMRDACPHRLLPLSTGMREGDSIRCKCHGLEIGHDGLAEEMPLKADAVNTGLCVEPYVVHERHRFVWIWVGDTAKADPALISDRWPCPSQGGVSDGGSYRVAADCRLMVDNLMGLTHETHVHAGSIGQSELMEAPIEACAAWWSIACSPRARPACMVLGRGAQLRRGRHGLHRALQARAGRRGRRGSGDPRSAAHAIAANPDLKLQGYNIDQGGVRTRQIIARLMRAQEQVA